MTHLAAQVTAGAERGIDARLAVFHVDGRAADLQARTAVFAVCADFIGDLRLLDDQRQRLRGRRPAEQAIQ